MGCIFCGRKPEKRLADDGKYYTGAEFVRHYGAVEAEWRWKAAPSDWELRIGSDGRSHDAKWVYWDNKNKGGPDWNHYKNGFKPGWTTAPKVGKHFRAENDNAEEQQEPHVEGQQEPHVEEQPEPHVEEQQEQQNDNVEEQPEIQQVQQGAGHLGSA